jgi:TPR repeat protein
LNRNIEEGLKQMQQAALLGSAPAQFHLGRRYEIGEGVPQDLDRARRSFRLCAAQGVGLCQHRLARLLFQNPGRPERDYVQAMAWFQLASEHGIAEAKQLVDNEAQKMTRSQVERMNILKAQFAHNSSGK